MLEKRTKNQIGLKTINRSLHDSFISRQIHRDLVAVGFQFAVNTHLKQERALGDQGFQPMVEKTLSRYASVRPQGRPRAVAPQQGT